MKNLPYIEAIAVLSLVIATPVSATDYIFQKPVSFLGTGCDAKSGKVLGVNTSILSVLFEKYDAGLDAQSGLWRSACNFAFPIQVPQGFQISQVAIDWDVYVKGIGLLQRKLFLAGNPRQSWKTNDFNEPTGKNFTIHDKFTDSVSPGDCSGGRYTVRLNSSVKAMDKQSYIVVDRGDAYSRITFKIKLKKC